jgi:hypothetical protein
LGLEKVMGIPKELENQRVMGIPKELENQRVMGIPMELELGDSPTEQLRIILGHE